MSFVKGSAIAIAMMALGAAPCLAVNDSSLSLSEQSSLDEVERVEVAGFLDDINEIVDTTNRVIDTVNTVTGDQNRPSRSAPVRPPVRPIERTNAPRYSTPRSNIQLDYSPMQREYQRRMQPGQNRVEQMFEERRAERARQEAAAARRREAFERMTPAQQREYRARQQEANAAYTNLIFQMFRTGAAMDGIINGPATPADEAAAAEAERMRIRMSRPIQPWESR